MASFITHSKKFVITTLSANASLAILAHSAILALAGIKLKNIKFRKFLLAILANSANQAT